MQTYRIVRLYFRATPRRRIIARGLTMSQVIAHCQNPETSSRTATGYAARKRTERMGPWFDGFESER